MPEIHTPSPALRQRKRRLTAVLLSIWLLVSFGPAFFARTLSFEIAGWPVHFWMASQGAVLVFIGIVVVYAFLMNRWEAKEAADNTVAVVQSSRLDEPLKQSGI